MSVVAKAAYFWRSAAQGLRHAPFIHFVAVLTIAIALFTAGLVRGTARLVQAVVSQLSGQVELTAYLSPEASGEDARALARTLEARGGGRATVVRPDEALTRLRTQLGPLGSALDDLPDNPLPTSVEVKLPTAASEPGALRALAEKVRALPRVEAVDYGAEAVERLSAIARALRLAALLALGVVGGATVVIVAATLQLAIYARREEIEIQKLVGATDRFVKAPFLLEGGLQGLLGAAVALSVLWGLSVALRGQTSALAAFVLGPSADLKLLDARLALELCALGCGLGLSGSFVAVGRFLRV